MSKQQHSVQKITELCEKIEKFLDDHKIEDIIRIDLKGKSDIADFMIIASGISQKHVQTTGETLKAYLHQLGLSSVKTEGTFSSEWVLLDAGNIIVHLFRPDVRSLYNLEKMWGADLEPQSRTRAG